MSPPALPLPRRGLSSCTPTLGKKAAPQSSSLLPPLPRDPREPDPHHGQAGAGPVHAVHAGDREGGSGGGHQQEAVAGDHQGAEPAHLHHQRGLHPAHPVSGGSEGRGAGRELGGPSALCRGWRLSTALCGSSGEGAVGWHTGRAAQPLSLAVLSLSQDQLQQKIICPGPVTCLTASPNGLYILAGVAESIYLWEVSNGNLLAILNRHYQDLTCLCFTDDSSHFLSGAKDCLALVWNLYNVLQAEPSQIPDPRHVWSRHSLPITDLCCGFGGPLARAATASLDQTAKLWEISSGELLLSVLFDVGIMAVTLDLSEYHMFCGGMDGSIFQVDLCAWPVQRDRTFQTERENGKVFKGHRNQVTCLSVSTDGSLLLSGSHDETVRLWDIQSKQCLKTMNHKGPVTNAFIVLAPANMFNPEGKPSVPLPKFSRHLHGTESSDEPGAEGVTLRLGLHQQVLGALGRGDRSLGRATWRRQRGCTRRCTRRGKR
uniref:WD repeat domain 18 n=1 Tax=Serinus canaria TaxID=9135 RepID=A0A8C9MTC5_SERCA